MLEFTFRPQPTELREARTRVSDTLRDQGIDSDHASAVVLVVNELIAAARECKVKTPVRLTVAPRPAGTGRDVARRYCAARLGTTIHLVGAEYSSGVVTWGFALA